MHSLSCSLQGENYGHIDKVIVPIIIDIIDERIVYLPISLIVQKIVPVLEI